MRKLSTRRCLLLRNATSSRGRSSSPTSLRTAPCARSPLGGAVCPLRDTALQAGKAQLITLHLRMLREQRALGTGRVVPPRSPQASQSSEASLASIRKPGMESLGHMTTQAMKRSSPHFRAEMWTPYSEQVLCPFYFLSYNKWISVSKLVCLHRTQVFIGGLSKQMEETMHG